MKCNRIVFFVSVSLLAGLCFFGLPVQNSIDIEMPSWLPHETGSNTVNIQIPDWLTQDEVIASPYRRSMRRTARRTSRRTARRYSGGGYYGRPGYYGGAAVATGVAVGVTALAVGTMINTLPPACNSVIVDGITYYNCSGTYYAPNGNQWVVVTAP